MTLCPVSDMHHHCPYNRAMLEIGFRRLIFQKDLLRVYLALTQQWLDWGKQLRDPERDLAGTEDGWIFSWWWKFDECTDGTSHSALGEKNSFFSFQIIIFLW